MGYDDVDPPLIRRDKRLLDGGRLEEDERFVVHCRVRRRGADVFDPTMDIVAEGEPDGSHAVLDDNVDELLAGLFVLVEQPPDEAVPDRKRLAGP